MKSDEELLQALCDPSCKYDAFEEIVRRYSQPLYLQIRRLVQWHDDANDVLQNTFMKAWGAITSFRGESRLSTWLYRIALNEALTFLTRTKTADSLDNAACNAVRSLQSDPYFDGDELQARLQEAISQLPPKQRIVFNMKYFDEMKYEEMSDVLGTSVGALKASYHLAVKKIEDYFREKN